MNHSLLRATFAALLPFSLLQACVVEEADDDIGVAPDRIVELDDCAPGEARWCEQEIDATRDGEQSCIEEDGQIGWTGCAPRAIAGPEDCYEGETWDGETCIATDSVGSTPIVLSFDGSAVRYTQGGGDFDLTGQSFNVATDWPTSATPWLALDRDGNGRIDSGAELFGSATRLASGAFARHGFEALAELDEDGDGAITAADAAFASLVVWADENADRVTQPEELTSLAEAGVTSISLDVSVRQRCDARGNCARERSELSFSVDGETRVGAAIDVHLSWR